MKSKFERIHLKEMKNRIEIGLSIMALVLPLLLLFSSFRDNGIPTYSLVKPRDYYSGVIKMRAEGADELYYIDYHNCATFLTGYIDNRDVYLSPELGHSEAIDILRTFVCPADKLHNTDILSTPPTRYAEIQYCYPCYAYENCVFVLDKYWMDSSEIIGFRIDSTVLFCSKQEQMDLVNNKEEYIHMTTDVDVFEYMNEHIPSQYKMIRQILIILFIQGIGVLYSTVFLKGYKFLALAVSFPLGSAIITTFMLCLDLLGIPFGLPSFFASCALLIVVPVFFAGTIRDLEIKIVLSYFALSLIALLLFAGLKMNYSGPDSFSKILLGLKLYKYGRITDFLYVASQFGMYEIFMHGISNLFGIQIFNLLYPYMGFTIIIIMFATTYHLVDRERRLVVMIATAIGALVLLTNSDFFLLMFWILSNGIMSAYFFILLISVVLTSRDGVDTRFISVLCAFIIISTRLEGGGVVGIILILSLLLRQRQEYHSDLVWLGIWVGCIIVAWNLCFMIRLGHVDDNTFWDTRKGCIMVALGIGLICASFVFKRKNIISDRIWEKRYLITTIAMLILSGLLSVIKKDAFNENIVPYLNHFLGKSHLSNSYILWVMILLGFVLFFFRLDDLKRMTISLLIIYVLYVFDLMLIRTGFPIHEYENDSSRRMLVLIMPYVVWMCSSTAGYMLSEFICKLRHNY